MYSAAVIGQPFFGLLVDRLDKRWVLAFSSLGSAISILAYLAVSGAGWAGEGWLFAFGFFTFSGFPLLLSLVSDYVPRRSSSLANALVWGFGSTAGGALGPVLVGAFVGGDYSRLGLAFALAAGAALVSAVATALLPRPAHVSRMAAFG
jgi:MFS family permease